MTHASPSMIPQPVLFPKGVEEWRCKRKRTPAPLIGEGQGEGMRRFTD